MPTTQHDVKEPATMATEECNSRFEGMIENSPNKSDMDMVEAGEASCAAHHRVGSTTCISFIAANKYLVCNKN
jgi:hypothetical protein